MKAKQGVRRMSDYVCLDKMSKNMMIFTLNLILRFIIMNI